MDHRTKLLTWGAAPAVLAALFASAGPAYADPGEPGEGAGRTAGALDATSTDAAQSSAPLDPSALAPASLLPRPGVGSLGSVQPVAADLSGLLPVGGE